MSSRSRRSVQFTTTSSASSSGGHASFSSSSAGDSSATSPGRISRIEEKESLITLNDRLSQYIDRVRQLESENQRLSYQIRSSEETVVKTRDGVRAAFEAELADARRLLDETAKDRARVQIDAGKYKAQVDELLGRIAKLERDLKDHDGRRMYAEAQLADEKAKAANAENARRAADDEAKRLRAENADLKKQLESARKQLEEETLMRVDLENRLQSLREELAFNKQLHEKELGETRHKRQMEITEMNTQLEDQYQQRLQDGLDEMRAQFDIQLKINRQEIEDLYDRKMEATRAQAGKDSDAAMHARDELKRLRIALETSEKERSGYETELAALTKKVRELEGVLQSERDNFYSRIATREEEIRRLKQEIEDMIKEYQDMQDTKIRLDMEIEAYRRLLESEESRLNLSADRSATASVSKSAGRGTKRKRVARDEGDLSMSYAVSTHQDSVTGIEIDDHDQEGNLYIRLINHGDRDVPLGGYLLRRRAGGNEVTHKFHRSTILKAGAKITVWGSDSEVTHSPPSDIVMKNQTWPSGPNVTTELLSSDGGDEVMVTSRETTSNKSSRIASGSGGSGGSYSYSYRSSGTRGGDLAAVNGDDKNCSIM